MSASTATSEGDGPGRAADVVSGVPGLFRVLGLIADSTSMLPGPDESVQTWQEA